MLISADGAAVIVGERVIVGDKVPVGAKVASGARVGALVGLLVGASVVV